MLWSIVPLVLPVGTAAYAFEQSDNFARVIVLLLVLLSIFAWTTMIDKGFVVYRARQGSKRFLALLEQAASPLTCATEAGHCPAPITQVFLAGLQDVQDILHLHDNDFWDCCQRGNLARPLTPPEIDKVRSTLERTVASEILGLEDKVSRLATTVTVSPFLGLLGTVWGVMMAFCGMAQQGRPDINVIAPGVSGALLTTVVGLIVAIPAVVGYNLIAHSIRQTTVEMDNFVEDFIAFLKLDAD